MSRNPASPNWQGRSPMIPYFFRRAARRFRNPASAASRSNHAPSAHPLPHHPPFPFRPLPPQSHNGPRSTRPIFSSGSEKRADAMMRSFRQPEKVHGHQRVSPDGGEESQRILGPIRSRQQDSAGGRQLRGSG